ncbi:MAG TPA: hypothetical protein VLJ59_00855 [Mycobacteriales bacterium]|nr:hypothetical protein [Mycobacteriales bacterium]
MIAGIGLLVLGWRRRLPVVIVGVLCMTAGSFFVGGSLWPHGIFSVNAAQSAVPPRIVSPANDEKVGLCVSVRGVVPPSGGDSAYWLVLHDTNGHDPYYVGRLIALTSGRSPLWSLEKVRIGRRDNLGKKYQLLLVRTEGDLTRDFAGRLKDDNRNLGLQPPPSMQVGDQILVLQTGQDTC